MTSATIKLFFASLLVGVAGAATADETLPSSALVQIDGKSWTPSRSVRERDLRDAAQYCVYLKVDGKAGFRPPKKEDLVKALATGRLTLANPSEALWTDSKIAHVWSDGGRGDWDAVCYVDGHCRAALLESKRSFKADTICVRDEAPPPAPVAASAVKLPAEPKLTLQWNTVGKAEPAAPDRQAAAAQAEQNRRAVAEKAERELKALERLQQERRQCQEPAMRNACGCARFLPPLQPGETRNCVR